MIGILLAGGAATRLPNKPLLPMRDLRPVCFSGMDYLLRHEVDHVAVVTPPSSVIVDVIDKVYGDKIDLDFIYQPEPTGVGDALNLVNRDGQSSLIVMADNVYPQGELLPTDSSYCWAVVRQVPAWRMPHLVRLGKHNHLTRTGPGTHALSTPWFLTEDCNEPISSEGWDHFSGLTPVIRPGDRWWDVGVPETYAAYWRNGCKDR